MSNYIESFKSKMPWSNVLERAYKGPLDRSSLFSTYEDAVKYAKGDASNPDSRMLYGTSYVGQIITVYENDIVTVYKINSNRDLEDIGSNIDSGVKESSIIVTSKLDEITTNSIGQLIYCTEIDNKGIFIINESQKIVQLISMDNDGETIVIDGGTF